MRQESKFSNGRDRGGNLSQSASAVRSFASFTSSTSFPSSSSAFLIDTPAIRIAPNSFDCIAGAHSNRHSSRLWKLHQTWAGAPFTTARKFAGLKGRRYEIQYHRKGETAGPNAANLRQRGNLDAASAAGQKPTPREMLRAKPMGPQHDGRMRGTSENGAS
jgi:hypothetical protein